MVADTPVHEASIHPDDDLPARLREDVDAPGARAGEVPGLREEAMTACQLLAIVAGLIFGPILAALVINWIERRR